MPPTRSARILVVSDGVAAGERVDGASAPLRAALEAGGFTVDRVEVCADGIASVSVALRTLCESFSGLVATTGGTGFGPRDLTPEGTRAVLDRDAPGLAEAMRLVNPLGRLGRGIAGTAGAALVLNLPGSPKGAVECLGAVLDVVPHALDLLAGERPH